MTTPLRAGSANEARPTTQSGDGGSNPTPAHQFDKTRYRLVHVPLSEVRALWVDGHYLGRARVGRQVNYAVKDLKTGLTVGAICYALPMMKLGYFGYRSTQMVELARLYLVDNVPNLAVWTIGTSLRLIPKDWRRLFPTADVPEVAVSWHDTVRHKGTIYRAANFRFYKLTKPRKRGPSRGSKGVQFAGTGTYTQDDAHAKGTWVYPLTPAAQQVIQPFLAAPTP